MSLSKFTNGILSQAMMELNDEVPPAKGNEKEETALDEIFLANLPKVTEKQYRAEWKKFVDFTKKTTTWQEADFVGYFNHLRTNEGLKGSTMWVRYSYLNGMYLRLTGNRLQNSFPRLKILLQEYQKGESTKKAEAFTLDEIKMFLLMDLPTRYWIIRKAAVAIGFCGSLRMAELRNVSFENVDCQSDGIFIKFTGAKQRKEIVQSEIFVPYAKDSGVCFGKCVISYLELVRCDIGVESTQVGPFFKGTNGIKGKCYLESPMGHNTFSDIPKDVARLLQKPNWNAYTGHSLRRSSVTSAANSGAGAFELTSHCRWASPKVAMEYIANSKPQKRKMGSLITGDTNYRNDACMYNDSRQGIPRLQNNNNCIVQTKTATSTLTSSQVVECSPDSGILCAQSSTSTRLVQGENMLQKNQDNTDDHKRNKPVVIHIHGGTNTFNF